MNQLNVNCVDNNVRMVWDLRTAIEMNDLRKFDEISKPTKFD